MPNHPEDLRYSKEHEWVRMEADGIAVIGITYFAQDQLGEVVFISLPKQGAQPQQNSKMGEIESVKTISDLFSPVSGEVTEVNKQGIDNPEWVNEDPYGRGWLIKIRISGEEQLQSLLSGDEYEKYIAG